MTPAAREIAVVAPNLKQRLSGVTATIVRLVPIQNARFGVWATGPGLPADIPHIPLWRAAFLPNDRMRVWHARRNTEMLLGLCLRHVLRRRLRLVFTSASQRAHSRYTSWLVARMDAVVATSARSAAYLERPAEVILHGIDAQTFSPAADKAALRRRLGLPEDAVLVGCYGRIREQKGTGAFVEALERLLPSRPGIVGVVMGRATAEHQDFLAGLKARAGRLEGRVLFPPEVEVDRIPDWYRALDLYVAPQLWEGFGLTPLEAMACGVPVVATTRGRVRGTGSRRRDGCARPARRCGRAGRGDRLLPRQCRTPRRLRRSRARPCGGASPHRAGGGGADRALRRAPRALGIRAAMR